MKVFFRTDSSLQMDSDHIMRVLILSEDLLQLGIIVNRHCIPVVT